MPDFITLLLANNPQATPTALALYKKSTQRAERRLRRNKMGNYSSPIILTADNIATFLEKLMKKSLYKIDLCDTNQYQQLYHAIYSWQPQLSAKKLKHLQQCGLIQNTLLSLLPRARQKQQKQKLDAACEYYLEHLDKVIATELSPQSPLEFDVAGFASSSPNLTEFRQPLSLAIEKYQVISAMRQALKTKKPTGTQLEKFNHLYTHHHKLIERNRDSSTTTFIKVIATIFTLGLAAACGIFSSQGKRTSRHLKRALACGSLAHTTHQSVS